MDCEKGNHKGGGNLEPEIEDYTIKNNRKPKKNEMK